MIMMGVFWIIVILGAVILMAYLKRPKCPQCGSRKCKRLYSNVISAEQTYIDKKVTDKVYDTDMFGHSNGKVLQEVERTVMVPATRRYYDVTYVCNECGTEFHRQEASVDEN